MHAWLHRTICGFPRDDFKRFNSYPPPLGPFALRCKRYVIGVNTKPMTPFGAGGTYEVSGSSNQPRINGIYHVQPGKISGRPYYTKGNGSNENVLYWRSKYSCDAISCVRSRSNGELGIFILF